MDVLAEFADCEGDCFETSSPVEFCGAVVGFGKDGGGRVVGSVGVAMRSLGIVGGAALAFERFLGMRWEAVFLSSNQTAWVRSVLIFGAAVVLLEAVIRAVLTLSKFSFAAFLFFPICSLRTLVYPSWLMRPRSSR